MARCRGDPAGATTASGQLLTDRLRVLGPDHPHTLTTRHSLANWRGAAGNPAVAVTALEQLLIDQLRVLGPNHPDTLATGQSLANWRGAAGIRPRLSPPWSRYSPMYSGYSALTIRILWPPATASRTGTAPQESGCRRHRPGAATHRPVAGAQPEPPGHPRHPPQPRQLARCRRNPAAAVTALEQLLTDRLRVLGPNHPQTLKTRRSAASWRGGAGDSAGTAAAYEHVLTDRLRVLGPNHPQTI
ncbi:tetratricopeptide repeat protein [Paractinoplanes durhamensis]|uniref:tetratricopeptide repeat protein n=1 Tax=Paractinoplanes durhamensis TaxID=113563 RepID=UPI0036268A6E